MRLVAFLLAAAAAMPVSAQPAGQSDDKTCADVKGDAEWRITACTNRLKVKSLTPMQKAEAYYSRAVALAVSDDFNGAVADVDAALRLPLTPYAKEALYVLKGKILIDAKRLDRALAVAETAVALRKGPRAYHLRADVKDAKGNHRGALADYDLSNAAGSTDANSWNGACWTRAADLNSELDKARKDCARAIELAPNSSLVLDSAGMVELRQGQYSAAWRFYDRAVKANGRDASARYGRGLSALKLGRTSEGNADLAAAIRIAPETATNYAKRGLKP